VVIGRKAANPTLDKRSAVVAGIRSARLSARDLAFARSCLCPPSPYEPIDRHKSFDVRPARALDHACGLYFPTPRSSPITLLVTTTLQQNSKPSGN